MFCVSQFTVNFFKEKKPYCQSSEIKQPLSKALSNVKQQLSAHQSAFYAKMSHRLYSPLLDDHWVISDKI